MFLQGIDQVPIQFGNADISRCVCSMRNVLLETVLETVLAALEAQNTWSALAFRLLERGAVALHELVLDVV